MLPFATRRTTWSDDEALSAMPPPPNAREVGDGVGCAVGVAVVGTGDGGAVIVGVSVGAWVGLNVEYPM